MQLSKVFSERRIRVGFLASNKRELFDELVSALAESETIDQDEILRTLWSREEMLSTRIAPGIAIPHTQVKNIRRTIGILGTSEDGIDYDLPNDEKIRLVVMIVDDENATIEHLDTLRNFALLARNPRFVQQVLAATTPKAVHELIRHFEVMGK